MNKTFELEIEKVNLILEENSVEALKIVKNSVTSPGGILYELNGKVEWSADDKHIKLFFDSYSFSYENSFATAPNFTSNNNINCSINVHENFIPHKETNPSFWPENKFFKIDLNINSEVVKFFTTFPNVKFLITQTDEFMLQANILLTNYKAQRGHIVSCNWGLLNKDENPPTTNSQQKSLTMMLKDDPRISYNTLAGLWVQNIRNLESAQLFSLLIQFMDFKTKFEFDVPLKNFILCILDIDGNHKYFDVTTLRSTYNKTLYKSIEFKDFVIFNYRLLLEHFDKEFFIKANKTIHHLPSNSDEPNNSTQENQIDKLNETLEFIVNRIDRLESKFDLMLKNQEIIIKSIDQKTSPHHPNYVNIIPNKENLHTKNDDPKEFKTLIKGIRNILDHTPTKVDQSIISSDQNIYGLPSSNLTLETKKYLDRLKLNHVNDDISNQLTSSTLNDNNFCTPNPRRINQKGYQSEGFLKKHAENELPSKILDVEKILQLPKLE